MRQTRRCIDLKTAPSGALATGARPNRRSSIFPTVGCQAHRAATCGQAATLAYGATPGVNSASTSSPWPVCALYLHAARDVHRLTLYPQEIDAIDFSVSGSGISWNTHLAPTRWDATSSPDAVGWRISLAVGIIAALVAILLGTAIGAIAGFFGGIRHLADAPDGSLHLAAAGPAPAGDQLLVQAGVLRFFQDRTGSGVTGIFVLIVLVIGLLNWMPTTRLVRASYLSTKQKEFVEAAEAMGSSRASQMFRHILPNVMSPIIVAATLGVGAAITESAPFSVLASRPTSRPGEACSTRPKTGSRLHRTKPSSPAR